MRPLTRVSAIARCAGASAAYGIIALLTPRQWKEADCRTGRVMVPSICGTAQVAAVPPTGRRQIRPIPAWESISGCSNRRYGATCRGDSSMARATEPRLATRAVPLRSTAPSETTRSVGMTNVPPCVRHVSCGRHQCPSSPGSSPDPLHGVRTADLTPRLRLHDCPRA
jgi:hypothetical protein